MKSTLVVFAVPGNGYVSCQGEDLATIPQPGVCYVLTGKLYEVEKVFESLGPHNGDAKLMELLSLAGEGADAGAVPQIRALGGSQAASGLVTTPSRVLLVRLRLVRKTTTSIRILVPEAAKKLSQADAGASEIGAVKSLVAAGKKATAGRSRQRRPRK